MKKRTFLPGCVWHTVCRSLVVPNLQWKETAMKKLLGVSATVAVLVLLGGVAFAQMGWGYGPGMMGMGP